MNERKVIIIGSGAVGSTYAYALTLLGIGKELGIIDVDYKKAIGDAIDLSDALAFTPQKKIYAAKYSDCKDAKLVVITAGIPQKPGESRLELVDKNLKMIKDIVEKVVATGFKGIFLVATNPVDIMTYATLKYSGFPKNRVIGSGTVLDTARLRKELAYQLDIDARNVHAYIIGEHGDSEFAIWSNAYISAIPIKEWLTLEGLQNPDFFLAKNELKVQNTAYEIINMKGATYYGIAMSLAKITKSILNDDNSILTVSTYLEGQYGHNDVCIGVPAIVNSDGIKKIVDLQLEEKEQIKMNNSVYTIKKIIQDVMR